jgi:two-component sensor histidine kinase/putative methionine-R-sulfoxide reductase with GAF domain
MRKPFRPKWPTERLAVSTDDVKVAESEAVVDALERIADVFEHNEPGTETLSEIAEIARSVTRTDAAHLFLLDQDGLLRLAADTIAPEQIGRVAIRVGQGLTGWAAEFRKPVVVAREPWADSRYQEYPGFQEEQFQSILCVPLIDESELIGVLDVRTRRAYGYDRNEARVLSRIADQVARAIRHQERVKSLETQAQRYEAVSEVTDVIAGSPYLEEILQLLVSFTAERLNYKVVTVRLLDEKRDELVLRATQSESWAYRRKRSIRAGESFAGRALVEKQIITTTDVTTSPDYIGAELAEEQGLRSMACVPLIVRDKAIGVMTCYTGSEHQFSRVELSALEVLAKQAAISIEHAKLQVRTTLMQEMHHRVKNSLQQVVSLLRLELNEAGHRTVEQVINDSLARILAIANVHDLLSREDLDRVGILDLANTLVQHNRSMIHPSKDIRINLKGENFALSVQQATQVSLMLNEMLQNAIEHGFEDFTAGGIDVEILRIQDDAIIRVQNDGKRLPDDFDSVIDAHLGLKIIKNLAKAVGGRFCLEMRFGRVTAEVIFSAEVSDEG